MLQVKLGISPINWINDDVNDIGDFYDVETVLRDMQSLGFSGTEMGRKYPRNASELRPMLVKHDLVLSGAWKTVQFSSGWNPTEDFEAFQQHIQFLNALGSEFVVVCDGGGSLNWDARGNRSKVEKYDDAAWKRLADGLKRAGEYAMEQGIRLVYHAHYGTGVETAEEIDRLMYETDPAVVSLLADTGHIYSGGGNPVEVIQKHIQRIPYMHLKDVRSNVFSEVRQHGTLFIDAIRQGMFTTPGDGCIEFDGVFRVLFHADYQGWLIIEAEQDPMKAEPVQYARAAKAYIEQLIQETANEVENR